MADGDSALGVLAETDAAADTEVLNQVEETPEAALPTGDEQLPVHEETGEKKPDARLLPKDIQRVLKSLRENPETSAHAKALTDSYFREQAYTKEGSIDEIRELKGTIETLGGKDGITELQGRAETLAKLDQDLESGNPAVLDSIPEEGFKKLVGPALSKLERLDPEAYSAEMRPHLVRAIVGSGLPDSLNMVQYLLGRGDAEEAGKQIKLIQQWIGSQQQEAANAKRNLSDPKQSDISRREQELNAREERAFKSDVAQKVVGSINGEIEKQVSSLFKGTNLTEGQKKHFAKAVYTGIEDALRGDKNYQSNLTAAISSKDGKRLIGYVSSQMPNLIARVARETRNEMYPTLAAAPPSKTTQQNGQRRPAAQPQENSGQVKPLRLPSRPADKDIDNARTNMTMLIAHKAYLKSGKYVAW